MSSTPIAFVNARLALPETDGSLQIIEDGCVVNEAGRITYAGAVRSVPEGGGTVDCGGGLITPGLIDPHTHLVYAGSRASEFARRLKGETYGDIARSGGGIVTTMAATRAASEDELFELSFRRLQALADTGVTTVEIKSGYGLRLEDEMKCLKVARRLGRTGGVRITTTLLAAHAVPPEFNGRTEAYIDYVCGEIIPAVAADGLCDAVDGFCETLAFSPAQIRRVFEAARQCGLPVKLHAEQLSHQGGAELAAEFGALSADHLEYLSDKGIAAMKAANTVATLLPGAFYYTRETRCPPVAALRAAGVPMAVGTDCNPGTSPLTSALMAMNMVATLFGLEVGEALAGMSVNAAQALGLTAETGRLLPGLSCDLAVWDVDDPAEMVAGMGYNPLKFRVFRGDVMSRRPQ